jgi:hypothetical protein
MWAGRVEANAERFNLIRPWQLWRVQSDSAAPPPSTSPPTTPRDLLALQRRHQEIVSSSQAKPLVPTHVSISTQSRQDAGVPGPSLPVSRLRGCRRDSSAGRALTTRRALVAIARACCARLSRRCRATDAALPPQLKGHWSDRLAYDLIARESHPSAAQHDERLKGLASEPTDLVKRWLQGLKLAGISLAFRVVGSGKDCGQSLVDLGPCLPPFALPTFS